MKEFIEYIVRQLVDNPDQVVLEEVIKDEKVIYKLKVAQSDIGKVIGKKGRNIISLRTIVSAVAKKIRKNVKLDVVA